MIKTTILWDISSRACAFRSLFEYIQPRAQWQVSPKMVNPGLSQILSKVFLSKSMQLELKNQDCWAFTPRCSNDNTKRYSTHY